MDTFKTIKKFLNDGGKCLLIENGEPIGVVLTIDEFEKLSEFPPDKGGNKGGLETEKILPANPIGETMAQEMDYAGVSADLADIQAVDDVTLEDLGIDEMTSID
ncbi:MAG: hypothetical protein Q7S78_01850 [Candidatus Azambacteria bacterium]|nr:hypothetical protein [Candidatus Azambacteria bacterium]